MVLCPAEANSGSSGSVVVAAFLRVAGEDEDKAVRFADRIGAHTAGRPVRRPWADRESARYGRFRDRPRRDSSSGAPRPPRRPCSGAPGGGRSGPPARRPCRSRRDTARSAHRRTWPRRSCFFGTLLDTATGYQKSGFDSGTPEVGNSPEFLIARGERAVCRPGRSCPLRCGLFLGHERASPCRQVIGYRRGNGRGRGRRRCSAAVPPTADPHEPSYHLAVRPAAGPPGCGFRRLVLRDTPLGLFINLRLLRSACR